LIRITGRAGTVVALSLAGFRVAEAGAEVPAFAAGASETGERDTDAAPSPSTEMNRAVNRAERVSLAAVVLR
jgi:hypothetical protein